MTAAPRKRKQSDISGGTVDGPNALQSRANTPRSPQVARNWVTSDSVRVYIPQIEDRVIVLLEGYAENIRRHHDPHHGVRVVIVLLFLCFAFARFFQPQVFGDHAILFYFLLS